MSNAAIAAQCGAWWWIVSTRVLPPGALVVVVCRYDDGTTDAEAPLSQARAIVEAMREAGSLVAGFSVDLGRVGDGWALVECNDGFALGLYPGLDPRSYAELLVARWMELSAGAR